MTVHYTLQFYDYWHTGSGLSGGTYADQVVNKTTAGLPIVPGKTIKGLLRHAAEDLLELGDEAISQEAIDAVFGQRHEKRRSEVNSEEAEDNHRTIGQCWFSSAELPADTAAQITEARRPQLYEILASTKIEADTGTAADSSLRQIEVTIPLTLTGHIFGVEEDQQILLDRCLRYVKRLGHNRSRGLGRCHFKLLDA